MWLVISAWIAAVLVFSSFFMKTMIPLRIVAIVSNLAFISYALLGITYGIFDRVYPILVLHACLLPLNLLRLRQLTRLTAAVHRATDADVLESLIPYMQTEVYPQGTVLFKQGDPADRLYMIQEGRIHFPEIDKHIGAGEVFGEVGLFAPQSVRALSAVCEETCRLSSISREKALELYYQNPKFGFFLIRLVSGLVQED
ncbi:MAG TPA: cyclic nucleotide-binding domain-containing protein, partial [Acidimicrobiia bacterium]|nr:cyclic nucleotide-binding domain-containing protein [Acidimicrobiia bacterium]